MLRAGGPAEAWGRVGLRRVSALPSGHVPHPLLCTSPCNRPQPSSDNRTGGCSCPCRAAWGSAGDGSAPGAAGREQAGACMGRGASAITPVSCWAGAGGPTGAPGPDRRQDGWLGLCTQLWPPHTWPPADRDGLGGKPQAQGPAELPWGVSRGHGHVWGAGGLCCCGGGWGTCGHGQRRSSRRWRGLSVGQGQRIHVHECA